MGKKEIIEAYKSNCLALEMLAEMREDRIEILKQDAENIRKIKKNFEAVLPILEHY
jgi:hypothetical protein